MFFSVIFDFFWSRLVMRRLRREAGGLLPPARPPGLRSERRFVRWHSPVTDEKAGNPYAAAAPRTGRGMRNGRTDNGTRCITDNETLAAARLHRVVSFDHNHIIQ